MYSSWDNCWIWHRSLEHELHVPRDTFSGDDKVYQPSLGSFFSPSWRRNVMKSTKYFLSVVADIICDENWAGQNFNLHCDPSHLCRIDAGYVWRESFQHDWFFALSHCFRSCGLSVGAVADAASEGRVQVTSLSIWREFNSFFRMDSITVLHVMSPVCALTLIPFAIYLVHFDAVLLLRTVCP